MPDTKMPLANIYLLGLSSDPRIQSLIVQGLTIPLISANATMKTSDRGMLFSGDMGTMADNPVPIDPAVIEDVAYVAGWIASSVVSNAAWVDNDNSIRLRLASVGTMAEAVRQANIASVRTTRSSKVETHLDPTVMQFEDGWRIASLDTLEALARDYAVMGSEFDRNTRERALASGKSTFFSLRDPHDRVGATIEIDGEGRFVREVCGGTDRSVVIREREKLLAFLSKAAPNNKNFAAGFWGFVTDHMGVQHPVKSLPETLKVRSDFISIMVDGDIVLPSNIEWPSGCGNTLMVSTDGLVRLRGKMDCELAIRAGSVSFADRSEYDGRKIRILAKEVNGLPHMMANTSIELVGVTKANLPTYSGMMTFKAIKCDTSILPDGFTCGMLILDDMEGATLPMRLNVGKVRIVGGGIEKLPDDIRVSHLIIDGCRTGMIPAGLHVRTMHLIGEAILPENLAIEDELTLAGGDGSFFTIPHSTMVGRVISVQAHRVIMPIRLKTEVSIDQRSMHPVKVEYRQEPIASMIRRKAHSFADGIHEMGRSLRASKKSSRIPSVAEHIHPQKI